MDSLRIPLRIVFYQDSDKDWIAHCLEFDLCGHGSNPDAAIAMLAEAIMLQIVESIKENNPDNLFSPADGKFFRMFAAGKDCAIAQIEIDQNHIHVDNVTAREFSGDCRELEFA